MFLFICFLWQATNIVEFDWLSNSRSICIISLKIFGIIKKLKKESIKNVSFYSRLTLLHSAHSNTVSTLHTKKAKLRLECSLLSKKIEKFSQNVNCATSSSRFPLWENWSFSFSFLRDGWIKMMQVRGIQEFSE